MSNKGNIKVIKRGKAAPKAKKQAVKSHRESAREMVSTVTDWVSELKERKSEETRAALELLFASGPRTNES